MLKCRDEEVDDNPLSKTKCQLSSRTCEVLLTRNTLILNIYATIYSTVLFQVFVLTPSVFAGNDTLTYSYCGYR